MVKPVWHAIRPWSFVAVDKNVAAMAVVYLLRTIKWINNELRKCPARARRRDETDCGPGNEAETSGDEIIRLGRSGYVRI